MTTHTPGILRGGMQAIDRRPKRNEVVVGGADGAPKLFKMDVQAAPADGGNPNQIRQYEAMPGRIYDVRFSADGTRFFAAGSLDGRGQVRGYETDSGKKAWQLEVPEAAIYAVACSAAGTTVAAAGADGQVRLIDAAKGTVRKTFMPVEVTPPTREAAHWFAGPDLSNTAPTTSPPQKIDFAQLQVEPLSIRIEKPTDYVQLLCTATLPGGARADATRMIHWKVEGTVGQISPEGRFSPLQSGQGRIVGELAGRRLEIPAEVAPSVDDYVPSFIRDVTPVLSRAGCNAGTCHGAAKGKNGFKLSLRGYDPILDHRALTDDLASRRINTASPGDSLMLLKPTADVPHQGGRVFEPDTPYYRTIRRWIAEGAKLDLSAARVTKIDIFPKDPVIEAIGNAQQMRIVATYADATTRDVTREAFIESGNTEVATADRQGVLTAVRRGEAPVLARYEGSYAATTLTVMGDRSGFVWQAPETWGKIDELVAAKWQRMKILPSGLCSDAEFLRRVYLDLTGLPPTAADVRAFLDDHRDTRTKRDAVIDRLIGSEDFVEHWTNKWADLLQVNRKYLGPEGAAAYRRWIRGQLAANTAYDEFVDKIVAATGSNRENPPASYFKILREPADTMEATTHLFLGVRFNCNKCHDHPFERWTQDQYYQTAAYFARVELKPDPASGDRKIEGTSVESAKPLYEIIGDKPQGEVVHDRTKAVAAPKFPFAVDYPHRDHATRRQELAAWLTAPANPYFAKSYVNRLWGYLLGAGIIEPLDDIRAGNPPTNPELLDYLTREFIGHHFDMRHMLRMICRSRTYQLSIEVNRWNDDDKINYSHAIARRLPAEVLYDAIHRVTGSVSRIPGVPVGTRAAALPDSGVNLPDGFLSNLGRPARESVCECERSSGLQLGPVMALISGPTVEAAVSDAQSELSKLVATEKDDAKLIGEIFLRVLNRPATAQEIEIGLAALRRLPEAHKQLTARLEDYEKQSARKGGPARARAAKGDRPRKGRIGSLREADRSASGSPGAAIGSSGSPAPRPLCASRRRLCRSGWPLGNSRPRIRPPGRRLSQPRLPPRTTPSDARGRSSGRRQRSQRQSHLRVRRRIRSAERNRTAARSAGRRSFAHERPRPGVQRQLRPLPVPCRVASAQGAEEANARCAAERPGRLQPRQLQRADRDWRVARRRVGRRAEDGPVTHGRLRDARQRRRSGSFHDPHGPEFRRRPAYSRPFPHLGDQRPAADHRRRAAGEHRRPFWPWRRASGRISRRPSCWNTSAPSTWSGSSAARPWPRRNSRCPSTPAVSTSRRAGGSQPPAAARMPGWNGCAATSNSAPSNWKRRVSRSPRTWPGP